MGFNKRINYSILGGLFACLFLTSVISITNANQAIAIPNTTKPAEIYDADRAAQALRDAEYLIEKGGAKLEKLMQEILLEADKVDAAIERINYNFDNKDIDLREKQQRLQQTKIGKNLIQQKKERHSILRSRLQVFTLELED